MRAGKIATDKPAQKGITLVDSAFGGLVGLVNSVDTHAQYKKEKAKTNKIMMNE